MALAGGVAAAEPEAISNVPLMSDSSEQEQLAQSVNRVMAPVDDSQSDLIQYLKNSSKSCADCAVDDEWDGSRARLAFSRVFVSSQRQWRDQGSVGLELQSGPTTIGLWGDVREVNILENEESYLLPSGLTDASTVPSAVNSTLSLSDVNLGAARDTAPGVANAIRVNSPGGGNLATAAPVSGIPLRVSGGSIGGRAATRSQSISNSADLAYKEYVGGLFMSQSF